MVNKFLVMALILLSGSAVQADYEEAQIYAQDKLVNAQAQLTRLQSQRKALDKLITAVKQDLKAAKIRNKAEGVQQIANTARQDASIIIEQAGIAVDLPDLMSAKGVQAGLAQNKQVQNQEKESLVDMMFKDKSRQESAVFFPSSGGQKTIAPEYIK